MGFGLRANVPEGQKDDFLSVMNYPEIKKRAPIIVFALSLTFWSFVYGVAVQRFRLFPFQFIRQAELGAKEMLPILTGKLPWYIGRPIEPRR